MADRNSIIEKIKALLAKTTANGATEAEMLSALDKASAMMDAYDITDADLREARDEAAMLHAEPPDLKDPHSIKWRLSYGVAEFCGVQIFRSRHQTGLKCIGMPSDVQFAMWLLDNLADFVFAVRAPDRMSGTKERAPDHHPIIQRGLLRVHRRSVACLGRAIKSSAHQQRSRVNRHQRRGHQSFHERQRHPPAQMQGIRTIDC
jgi:Protein of unknown function (DUF2786)